MATAANASRENFSEAEWATRCDLAALYRILHRLRMTDFIYTHLSARVPDEPGHMLINRYGELFNEVTASSLVKMDMEGNVVGAPAHFNNAGFTIHSGVYMARPDAMCVIHLHTKASIALSATAAGLLPISQHSMMVAGSLGYHDYEGPAVDWDERETLGRDCAKADAIVLKNHGLLAIGRTIPAAFRRAYYFETSCQIQTAAMAGGAEVTTVPQAVQDWMTEMFEKRFRDPDCGQREWTALLRTLEREGLGGYRR